MSTGYPGPEISRDQKILGPKNLGILKAEKSWNKKSRDYEYKKDPGILKLVLGYPGGIFSPLFMRFCLKCSLIFLF